MKEVILTIAKMGTKTLKSMNNLKTIFQYIKSNFNYKCAFLLPLVLKTIKDNPQNIDPDNPFIMYIYSTTTVLVFTFLALINIFFYLLVLYLINNYDVEIKFSRFIKFINFYKKTTKVFLAIEITIVIIALLSLITINTLLIINIQS